MWDSWCVNVNSYVFCAVITIPLLLSIVKLQKSKGYHQLNCTFPFFQLWRNMNIIIWYNNSMVAKSLCGELLDLFVPFSIWSLYFVLLRITASGCTFGIFKLFFNLDFDDSLLNHIVFTYIRYVFKGNTR